MSSPTGHGRQPAGRVLDPAGLDAAAMQAIAAEFNLSKTVFVLPRRAFRQPRQAAHLHASDRASLRWPPDGGTAVCLALLDPPARASQEQCFALEAPAG